ncbi:MAG: valine--tRNA ligase [Cyclobacteriaceae bacterium]|nr:valine--tRNA ligase [Cyclobacteriaceae bacterium]
MSELSAKYAPSEVEDKWYSYWMEKGFFKSQPNPEKESFTIVIPPPNVTGILHMGHMLNNTIQDILTRKARMDGKEALWLPGTDHASIATEAKVVGFLREKGIKKSDLSRDEFLKYAWEWKEKYGGIILEQLKKLGASCDWDRTAFTMDDYYYKSVIRVFVDLHKKGYIYRGLRMINWDCEAQTALSNEEVVYREDGENATMYSVKYKIEGTEDQYVTIATVRPETILGDTAIAVNPDDERYAHLVGKKAIVPFVNRAIPIIADGYVDKEFGTGCLKVTPAHDTNDYEIGKRHNLDLIDTLNADGTLNEACGIEKFIGKDRFVARKMIVKDLEEAGILVGKKDFVTKIGRSERTDSVVEPRLSLQWFIKMKEISKRALDAVENDEVLLHPSKFKNTYRHWMENVRDWCISRQLWWGQRIPAYYYGENEDDFVVAETQEEALMLAREKSGNSQLPLSSLKQDEDVLDTWASSWLWPTAPFHAFEDDQFDKETGKIILSKDHELSYYYPTSVLVTAPEILFFWVARMIIAGYEYTGEKPFKDVYLTGIVRDKAGRKMSKSLGNSPDPLELIEKYGADAVRTGMLFSSPAGNDLLFDIKLCEQGRNFANKIWNAYRLLDGWEKVEGDSYDRTPIIWFKERLNQAILEIEDHFSKFRISDALMSVYKLIWDDFCSWYLEMIKPEFGSPINQNLYNETRVFFEELMKLLHPFMPFISEELWHALKERKPNDSLMLTPWPKVTTSDQEIVKEAELAFEIIGQIRNYRNKKSIKPKEALKCYFTGKDLSTSIFAPTIKKLAVLEEFSLTNEEFTPVFITEGNQFNIPVDESLNEEAEIERLSKELEYQEGFRNIILKKLENKRFVDNAPPQVVESENKKLQDAEAKILVLKESIERFQN